MSPLWRDRVGIAVSPECVTLVRLARGVRPRVVAKLRVMVEPPAGEAPWRAALAGLGKVLGEAEWQNADVTVVLSNHFARYACVPWNAKASGEDEQLALARHRFARIYGAAQQDWELRLSSAPNGTPRLASAVDGALLDALRQASAQHNVAVCSIQPYLMAGFNRFAGRLGKEYGWYVAAESGSLCIGLIQNGQWLRIRMLRDDGMESLNARLDRENLASELKESCMRVFLFAPEADQGQVGAGSYEIRRLELPAYEGFSPASDAQYAMAMSGAV